MSQGILHTIVYTAVLAILILIIIILLKILLKIKIEKGPIGKNYKGLIENSIDLFGAFIYQLKQFNFNIYRLTRIINSSTVIHSKDSDRTDTETGIEVVTDGKEEYEDPISTTPDLPKEESMRLESEAIEEKARRFLKIPDYSNVAKEIVYSQQPSDFMEIERKKENNEDISIVTVSSDVPPIKSSAQKNWYEPLFEFSGDLGRIEVIKYAKVKWQGESAYLHEQGIINLV